VRRLFGAPHQIEEKCWMFGRSGSPPSTSPAGRTRWSAAALLVGGAAVAVISASSVPTARTESALAAATPAAPTASARPATSSGDSAGTPSKKESESDRIRKLVDEGKLDEAERQARALLAREERIHGNDSAETADALDLLIGVLAERGWSETRAQEIVSLARRVVQVKEKIYGPDDPEVANGLGQLAHALNEVGAWSEAREVARRELAIQERAFGSDDPQILSAMNHLAIMHRQMGDPAESQRLHARALAIAEKAYAPDDKRLVTPLLNLAIDVNDAGDYTPARSLYERALAVAEKAYGPDGRRVALVLENMSTWFADIGDYAEARSMAERATAIYEKTLEPNDPALAWSHANLGDLMCAAGDYAAASPHYDRALKIALAMGEDHVSVSSCLSGQASVAAAAGDLTHARELRERALQIEEKALGANHLDVADARVNLADVLVLQGDYAAARVEYQRALQIQEDRLGLDHPIVAPTLRGLASVLARLGESQAALDSALRVEALGRASLTLTSRSLPERQALRFAAKRPGGLDLVLTLAAGPLRGTTAAARAWDALIRSRALVLDEMASRHHAVVASSDSATMRLNDSLRIARERLAGLMVREPGDDLKSYRRLLDETGHEQERLERRLAERSSAFGAELRRRSLGFDDVTRSLPAGCALLAYAYAGAPTKAGQRQGADSSRTASVAGSLSPPAERTLLAFVIRAGEKAPAVFSLGSAETIDQLVSNWRRSASQPPQGRLEPDEAAYRRMGEALRKKIWDPVQGLLADADQVFIVPDGVLSLVNWGALPVDSVHYLVERSPMLSYLSAERDLVPVAEPVVRGAGLIALGGPDYDQSAERPLVAGAAGTGGSSPYRGSVPGCADFKTLQFRPLPGTRREVQDIAQAWRTRKPSRTDPGASDRVIELLGPEASETAFKREAPGERVVHLATHGFFLSGSCTSALESGRRGIGGMVTSGIPASTSAPVSQGSPPAPGVGDNPLLLSGLALAGANRRATATPGQDDGILTAEEVASLDLSGVEWAVLSACETGTGEVMSGEGVFGLRRAFQVAGARTLIMSLWAVEDESTRQWMNALYHARFGAGLPTAKAVREACSQALEERRKRKQSTHPFYWAAFIAVGDWR
jgi:CHAT domain-containing protein/tetratricopeptide (TPR) repeat protein